MFLHGVSLKEFRCFEDLTVEFDPSLTVLVGNNAEGKTAILEAAAIALGTLFSSFGKLKSPGIELNDVRFTIQEVGGLMEKQRHFPAEISAEAEICGRELSWRRTLVGEKSRTTVKEAKEIISLGAEWQTQLRKGNEALILPVICYYGVERIWDYHRDRGADDFQGGRRQGGYAGCLDGTANLKQMMRWFRRMTITKYQQQEIGEKSFGTLDVIFQAMAKCFQLASGGQDVHVLYDLNANELFVNFMDGSTRMRFPLALMSTGYRSTLSLVADIAYRMANLNPQLGMDVLKKTDGVVLVDEVDLHLHPTWQQVILETLRSIFPKVQFIVTTHAPAVINTVQKEKVRILQRGQVLESSVQTIGKDMNSIANIVMEASERPKDIVKKFSQVRTDIDAEKYDVAEENLDELERIIGNDPEITSLRVRLDMEKMSL